MQFTVHARGQGKRVRVVDRIGGADALNQFLGPDESADVTVASNDGQSGDVDIVAQMRNDSPWVNVQTDYAVRSGEVVEIDDV
jgi:hypothetical protein